MQATERGPRHIGAGIGWLIMVLLMIFGFLLGFLVLPVGLLFFVVFGLLGAMCGVKMWGAFTGIRRVKLDRAQPQSGN